MGDMPVIALDEGLQKMVSDVLSGMNRATDTSAKLAETFGEADKTWKARLAEIMAPKAEAAKEVAKVEEKAELKESLTSTFKDATKEIVPLAIGGGGAIFLTEVIDGVMITRSGLWKGGVKAVIAVAVWKWGDKIPFVNRTAKNIAAALVAFDAIRSAIPAFPNAISRAANTVSNRVPVGGLGDQRGRIIIQADKVANDYYARAFGR